MFWTKEKGYKLYVNGLMGNKARKLTCPEDCVSVKMMDGNCDQEQLITVRYIKAYNVIEDPYFTQSL